MRWSEHHTVCVAVSMDRAWASIAAASDGERVHLGSVRREGGVAWVVDEVARIQTEHNVVVVMDDHGPAGSLIPALNQAGVHVTATSTDAYLKACVDLFDAAVQGRIEHGNYTDLNEAVGSAEKRQVGERGWAWSRKSGDVSMLEATTLAAWGAASANVAMSVW